MAKIKFDIKKYPTWIKIIKKKELSSLKPKILLLDEPHPKAREIIESVAECKYRRQDNYHSDISAIYTQLTPIITSMPVFCPCTGVDHIQAPKIIHLDDEWKRTEGQKITSTAEHTWSLILQLAKINQMQLSGKKIGIIGLGRIGSIIARYAWVTSMEIAAYDIKSCDAISKNFLNRGADAEANEIICSEIFPNIMMRVKRYDFDRLLKWADIITLHVPLNDETRGMIGKKQFDMMKPGTLLVNTSRAEIVDEDALFAALKNGNLGGYADDFDFDHKNREDLLCKVNYLKTENIKPVILTPHIAGNCKEARESTDIYIANKIKEYIERRYL